MPTTRRTRKRRRVEQRVTSEVLNFLGLANRAGAVVKGAEAVRQAARRGEALLVLYAGDASERQKEKVLRSLGGQGVPHREIANRVSLGAAVGKGSLTAVAITDASFAAEIQRRLTSH